jgi:hypothetical protein
MTQALTLFAVPSESAEANRNHRQPSYPVPFLTIGMHLIFDIAHGLPPDHSGIKIST